MIVEVAAILVAIAFAVLVGYLVPVLIQIRKTVAESEQLVTKLNVELPPLIADLRSDESESERSGRSGAWRGRACGRLAACRGRGWRIGQSGP